MPLRILTTSLVILPLLAAGVGTAPVHAQVTPSAQEQLWDAARSGDTLALGKALTAGAKIDSLDVRVNRNGRRALNWAAWFNHPDAVRFLIAKGATVNLDNRTGFTPLHHAAENGSLEAAQALLDAGADPTWPNNMGETPAQVARKRMHLEVALAIEAKMP
ncbi:MAG TPA: ankyrin repeat domain-containing protein [Gemmatimonadales bacterium]|nr:ankyrin repeat domain-containing protein [Gemmatimonadales bacterium]